MKHWCWLILLCAFSWSSCSDSIEPDAVTSAAGEVYVNITMDEFSKSRTVLTSSGNWHHVQTVYAILYKGTGETATYVDSRNLNWNPMSETDQYGESQSQSRRFELQSSSYSTNGDEYTILCIGLDDKSDSTYNLPNAIKGKTLAEAKAILAEGKTKEDIATSELFAGWSTFSYNQDAANEVTVVMRRRVAGVICYLKDIPYKLSENIEGVTNTYRITKVQLELHSNQNKSTSLIRRNPVATATETFPPEFVDSPLPDSEVLWSQSLEGYSYQTDNPTLYTIPNTGQGTNLKANTLFGSAYLLPIENTATSANEIKNNPTLKICLYGKLYNNENNTVSGSELLVKSFPAVYEEASGDKNRKAYNIRANYIYHIGLKPAANDTIDDQPVSLIGTELILRVLKWNEEVIPVDFPNVPIYATMEFANGRTENYIYDCIGSKYEEIVTLNSSKDDIVITEKLTLDTLNIYKSLMSSPWKLVVDKANGTNTGVFIKKGVDSSGEYIFDTEFGIVDDGESAQIELLIPDYIVRRTYNSDGTFVENGVTKTIEDDYRVTTLLLQTYDDTKTIVIHTDTFYLKQYNAITVTMSDDEDDNGQYRAFNRFDVETYRDNSGKTRTDLNISEPESRDDERPLTPLKNNGTGVQMGFGYWGSTATNILGEIKADKMNQNGEYNYREARDHVKKADSEKREWKFNRSAIQRAVRYRLNVTGDATNGYKVAPLGTDNETYWYLPGTYELIPFLYLSNQLGTDAMNIKVYSETNQDNQYWSSQPKYGDSENAWPSYIDASGTVAGYEDYIGKWFPAEWKDVKRTRTFFLRRACHID